MHSPEQIQGWLRQEHPEDPEMWVSDETIYQAIYVQGRGGLRRELHALSAHRARAAQTTAQPRPARAASRTWSTSPSAHAEADDRAVPGHWEGDLIIGKDCRLGDRHPGRTQHRVRACCCTCPTTTPPAAVGHPDRPEDDRSCPAPCVAP